MKLNLFLNAFSGSWYTITGCGGDIEDWKNGYNELLDREGCGTPTEWHSFTGKDMNEMLRLTGDNRYPDSLVFLAFPLEGMNIGKLAMFKLMMRDRWFDDIVDNDLHREGTTFEDMFGVRILADDLSFATA